MTRGWAVGALIGVGAIGFVLGVAVGGETTRQSPAAPSGLEASPVPTAAPSVASASRSSTSRRDDHRRPDSGVEHESAIPLTTSPEARDDATPVVAQCFESLFHNSTATLEMVMDLHRASHDACRLAVSRAEGSLSSDDDPCGPSAEPLWAEANVQMQPILLTARNTVFRSESSLRGVLFADLDCATLNEEQFGAAAHLVQLSGQWVGERFTLCALRRAAAHEDTQLWALMDSGGQIDGAISILREFEFSDARTLRRLHRLAEASEQ